MHPNTHRILFAFVLTVTVGTLIAGIFSVGYVVGFHHAERNAAFYLNKNFPPAPLLDPRASGSGMLENELFPPTPVGMLGKDPEHRFALNGIIKSVSSGSLLIQDGRRVVKRVLFLPEMKVRSGGREMSQEDLAIGMHVSVLGRDTPDNPSDVNAMIIMIKK